ncbi:preprotein translocase subunit SecG [Thalassotalea sp. HSM 43]|nr:preprotein translocase subunit SecG [Thalassotalea sp. HSM 43]
MLYQVLLVVYLIIALILVGFILIQQGKGADMGASFGAGSSATIFGSSGSGNFMTKTTAILATVFFVTSLILGNLTAQRTKATDEWNNLGGAEQVESATPASDVPASDDKKESDVPN